ncbi:MAG: cobalamin-dependent protein, partial [Candidatus Hodarchaeales archaeon]
MRILLITPPGMYKSKYQQQAFLNFTSPPLGLAYLAAYLRKHGYDTIRIIDSQILLLSMAKYRELLARWHPDFLGIQVLTPNYSQTIKAADIAKDLDVPCVALGGMHATFLPREILETS